MLSIRDLKIWLRVSKGTASLDAEPLSYSHSWKLRPLNYYSEIIEQIKKKQNYQELF